MAKKIRVFIICPHALVREGLCALLERQVDIAVIARAADGVPGPQPTSAMVEVVIGDVEAASSEVSLAAFVARYAPRPVVMLTRRVEYTELLKVLGAHAQGYLPFDATPAELLDAIRAVSRGELALHGSAARALVEGEQGPRLELAPEGLSERERQVLQLLCEGRSNKQIAQKLFISVRTVEGRLNSIYSKLGVHSRAEAIVAATRQGMTFADEDTQKG